MPIPARFLQKSYISLSFPSLHPRFSVEASVADGFGDVVALDVLTASEVGDGAGNLEDAFVGSGGEVEVGHCTYQQFVAWCVQLSVFVQEGGVHLGVAMDALDALETLFLNMTSLDDTLTDGGRRLPLRCTRQLLYWYTNALYMQVYPIEDFRVQKSY